MPELAFRLAYLFIGKMHAIKNNVRLSKEFYFNVRRMEFKNGGDESFILFNIM